jgi:hypothetical protein
MCVAETSARIEAMPDRLTALTGAGRPSLDSYALMAQRERYAAPHRNDSRTNLRRSPDGVCFRSGAMAHHRKSRPRRTRSPGSLPDDLYDYLRPASRRRGRPARKTRSEWIVTDDWPDEVPITEAEIEVFEAWFGELFDELFSTRH